MHSNKKLNYEIDDILLDYKLFDTLKAINNEGSQRKAANSLNISHSVLNRRILKAEELLNQQLVTVSNKGSKLTGYALLLLEDYESYEYRLNDDDIITVAGGYVSCEFIRQLSKAYHINIRVIQSDLDTCIKLADSGMVDILAFDDPVKAYMLNIEPIPLARDCLLLLAHENENFNDIIDLNGLRFVEVDGSSQRLAWTTLADYDLDFDIVTYVDSYNEAIKMVEADENLYTFINNSMSYRCQHTSNIISKQTQHIISAFNVKNDTSIDNFLNFASHRAQKLTQKYGFKQL